MGVQSVTVGLGDITEVHLIATGEPGTYDSLFLHSESHWGAVQLVGTRDEMGRFLRKLSEALAHE